MKKNKMMRIASVLLVMTLLSTCAISGTFAKYVTKASGEDSARVAKWGVVIGLEAGDAFATQYKTHDTTYKGAYSVVSADQKKVVAPGTSSEDLGTTIKATVKGTPEVATRYKLEITGIKDVKLPAGTYTDYTELVKDATTGKYGYTKTFTLDKDYTPILWTLKIGGTAVATDKSLTEVLARVGDIAGKLPMQNAKAELVGTDGLAITFDADPNYAMDLTFELSWKWTFFVNDANDKADTYLGNVAAGTPTDIVTTNVVTEVAAKVVASATQID